MKILPSNRGGMALACICVIVLNPMSFIPFRVRSLTCSPSDSNDVSDRIKDPYFEPATTDDIKQ